MNFSATDIINVHLDDASFNTLALEVFSFQSKENPVYKQYLALRNFARAPKHFTEIPFLPIDLFRTHRVLCKTEQDPETEFHSSGTTGHETSKHYIADAHIYEHSFMEGFRLFFGDPKEYEILALLPSYLERSHSSLIYMVEHLMKSSGKGAFFLHNQSDLADHLERLEQRGEKSILFGVSYALLDFAADFAMKLAHCTIIETGGMKGVRKEITKQELHAILKTAFGTVAVSSEYGMTELLSQAYAINSDTFRAVPWMKPIIRDLYDPFAIATEGKGGLNIIDLANIYSCSFIETQDIGSINSNCGFQILGRTDQSQIRGCNLLVP